MQQKFNSAPLETQQRWSEIRLLLLDRIWRAMLIMAATAIPISISRSFFTGWQPVYSVHLLFMVTVAVINVLGYTLSYRVRALLVIVLLDAASLSGLLNFGLLGSAWWWMFLAGLLAGHFYNRRVELWHIVGSVVAMLVTAYCYVNGYLTIGYDANEYVRQLPAWLTALAGPALLTILVFRALSIYQDAVYQLLQEIEGNRKESKDLATQLELSLAEIKTLRGFIPICANCKKVRDDQGYWDNVETYIQQHSDAKFTHLVCPPCGEQLYGKDWLAAMADMKSSSNPTKA